MATTKVIINGQEVIADVEFIRSLLGFGGVSARTESVKTETSRKYENNIDKFYDEEQSTKAKKPFTYSKKKKDSTPTAYPLKTEDFADFKIDIERNAIILLNIDGEDNLRFVAKTAHTVLVDKIKAAGGKGRKIKDKDSGKDLFIWVFPTDEDARKFAENNKVVLKKDMNKLIREWNKKRGF